MASLKLTKLKCTENNPDKLKIQPRIGSPNGKNVGRAIDIDAPDTVLIPPRGNDVTQAGNNPIEVDVFYDRLFAEDLLTDRYYESAQSLQAGENWYKFRTGSQRQVWIRYRVEGYNVRNLTVGYGTYLITQTIAFVRAIVIATATYFSSLVNLLLEPFQRDEVDDEIDDPVKDIQKPLKQPSENPQSILFENNPEKDSEETGDSTSDASVSRD